MEPPSALADQAVAGGIMWAGGDLLFLMGMGLALRAWLRDEDEKGRRNDARLDREATRRAGAAGARGVVAARGDVAVPEGDAAG